MIARHWRGLAKADRADDYVAHLRQSTFPAIQKLKGFVSASILRRPADAGVEFLIVTNWESLDAIRAFAGANIETAVVPDEAQVMLIDFDRLVRHYDVIE
jgi:heme-degrading monooxygenase HmoA